MFEEPTVLILGAGASCNYHYPTGEQLIEKIRGSITPNKLSSKNHTSDYQLWHDLTLYNPLSIDFFLHKHPKHQERGKFHIAKQIILCEQLTAEGSLSINIGTDKKGGDWHRYLWTALLDGCDVPEDIHKNKLSIITFNYDMSLEFFLYKKIHRLDFLKDEGVKFFNTLNIHHVYGSIYKKNEINYYGLYREKDAHDTEEAALRYAKNIQVIGEERMKEEVSFSNWLDEAKKIFILGFGFDLQNLQFLNLKKYTRKPEVFTHYTNLGNSKKIEKRIADYWHVTGGSSGSSYNYSPKRINSDMSERNIYEALCYDFDFTQII